MSKDRVRISELAPGAPLPGLSRSITQEKINHYARASGDFNPVHVDEEFARQTPAGGTIAHGMLVLAYVSQMMTAAFGRDWLTAGRLSVRFKQPGRPGDTLTVSGKVGRIEPKEDRTAIVCSVLCQNQKGEPVVIGEASLAI